MLFCFCFRACPAHSLYLHTELLNPKTRGQSTAQLQRIEAINVDIRDGPATSANQVMMRMNIGINAPAMMRGYFAQHAGLYKCLEIFIDGR
jgi:hypothetical protein